MERTCEHCGTTFKAKRSTARFCSSSCRGKATQKRQRQAKSKVTVVEFGKLTRDDLRGNAKLEGDKPSGLMAAVQKQLEDVGKLDTYVGQQAIFLAMRLTHTGGDTGSAVAALSKELERLMALALADVKGEPDMLDLAVGEVVQMRTRRRG